MNEEGSFSEARLAVLEEKIERICQDLAAVRRYIPEQMIAQGNRIEVLERQNRVAAWLGGVMVATSLSALAAHLVK